MSGHSPKPHPEFDQKLSLKDRLDQAGQAFQAGFEGMKVAGSMVKLIGHSAVSAARESATKKYSQANETIKIAGSLAKITGKTGGKVAAEFAREVNQDTIEYLRASRRYRIASKKPEKSPVIKVPGTDGEVSIRHTKPWVPRTHRDIKRNKETLVASKTTGDMARHHRGESDLPNHTRFAGDVHLALNGLSGVEETRRHRRHRLMNRINLRATPLTVHAKHSKDELLDEVLFGKTGDKLHNDELREQWADRIDPSNVKWLVEALYRKAENESPFGQSMHQIRIRSNGAVENSVTTKDEQRLLADYFVDMEENPQITYENWRDFVPKSILEQVDLLMKMTPETLDEASKRFHTQVRYSRTPGHETPIQRVTRLAPKRAALEAKDKERAKLETKIGNNERERRNLERQYQTLGELIASGRYEGEDLAQITAQWTSIGEFLYGFESTDDEDKSQAKTESIDKPSESEDLKETITEYRARGSRGTGKFKGDATPSQTRRYRRRQSRQRPDTEYRARGSRGTGKFKNGEELNTKQDVMLSRASWDKVGSALDAAENGTATPEQLESLSRFANAIEEEVIMTGGRTIQGTDIIEGATPMTTYKVVLRDGENEVRLRIDGNTANRLYQFRK